MSTSRVTLDCRSPFDGLPHTIQYAHRVSPPGRGESVWCVRCRALSHVIDGPPVYRIRCITCTAAAARYDGDKSSAIRAAKRHSNKCPSHTVQLKDGRSLVSLYKNGDELTLETAWQLPLSQNVRTSDDSPESTSATG